jgi:hypothetical protein
MSILRRMVDRFKGKPRETVPGSLQQSPRAKGPAVPVIETQFGNVTESARLRCAFNMREDNRLREKIETLLAEQIFEGDIAKGQAESRKRYPEAYE